LTDIPESFRHCRPIRVAQFSALPCLFFHLPGVNPQHGETHEASNDVNRELIIALAARYRVRAIYFNRFFSELGGLISYGDVRSEQFRLAAGYIDRILKGEKPADLPVQAPTKFELIINLKTAKALGLTIPESFLTRADEVIE
jgi:putative tryptophan/tyrosine transport system substrate-binding protein